MVMQVSFRFVEQREFTQNVIDPGIRAGVPRTRQYSAGSFQAITPEFGAYE